MTDTYMCPFCRDVNNCCGPHIPEKDLESFQSWLEYERQAAVCKALERVMLLPIKTHGLNRSDVFQAMTESS